MSHPGATATDRHKVVIIGSGFGGLTAAKTLKRADVDIKMIAKTTHHLFQPLLYQVATGIISSGEIAPPTRLILRKQKNAQVLLGDVTHVDLANKTVTSELLGHTYVTPVRQPDHRGGRRPVLLRQRPFRRVGARHEVDRRRAGAARPHPRRVRAGRAVQRSGPAGEAADVHRRRRGPDGCRDGRADRRTRRPHAQRRVPPHRFDHGAGDPARRRCPRCCRRWARSSARRRRPGWRRWASRSSSAPWSPTSTATASPSRTPTAPSAASSRRPRCGRPVCRPARWAATSPTQSDVEIDRAGRVKVLPDLSVPGHPNVFVVGDMAAVEGVPGMAQGAIQGGKYVAKAIKAELQGRQPGGARAVPVLRQGLDGDGVAVLRGRQDRPAGVRRVHRLAGLAGAAPGLSGRLPDARSPRCCRGR